MVLDRLYFGAHKHDCVSSDTRAIFPPQRKTTSATALRLANVEALYFNVGLVILALLVSTSTTTILTCGCCFQ
jgi:hypothetical protein